MKTELDNIQIRQIALSDLDKGLIELLGQLSDVSILCREDLEDIISVCLNSLHTIKYIIVAEDLSSGKIVGTASVLIEPKLIRNGICAHIEDVVVDQKYRKHGLGKAMIAELIKYINGFSRRAYKFILNCDEHNVEFYKKCGFYRSGVCMRRNK